METKQPYLFLVFLMLSAGITCAQSTQSAMYDAIALMNATNGINAIFIGHPHSYEVIDPLGKEPTTVNQQKIPTNLRNNDVTSRKIISAILKRNANLDSTANEESLRIAYCHNPFLNDLFAQSNANFTVNQDATLASLTGFTTSDQDGSVAGNFSGNIINGVTDFVVNKAVEELSASVFVKLQDFIKHYPEFNILFPKTLSLLKPIQPYDYAKALVAFKAAIQADLNELPGQLPQLYQLSRYQLLNEKVPELTLVFASAQLFSELHGKSSLSKSLHDLDTASCLKAQNNYATMIHLAIITSNSVRKKLITDNEDGDYPYFRLQDIDLATHKNAKYTAQLGKFYLGLLWQQLLGYQIYDKDGAHPLSDLIGERYIGQTDTIVKKFVASSDKLDDLGRQLETLKERDVALTTNGHNLVSVERFKLYNQLIVTTMQLLQPFVAGNATDHPEKLQLSLICTYWPQFSVSCISMIKDVSSGNNNLAIADLSSMLSNLSAYQQSLAADTDTKRKLGDDIATQLNTNITALKQKIDNIDNTLADLPHLLSSITDVKTKSAVITQSQYQNLIKTTLQIQLTELIWEKDNSKEVLVSLSKVLSYIDLLASLSQAGNSQEVETLLENYALPAGSSRVKKDASFNIAVNAYVGGFYRPSSPGTGFTNTYGLTAPIGFTFSLGFQKTGSLSLFLGAVDIGSVIQYKLNNQGQYEQNINFAGLVSPSVHLAYGFGGYLPISFGLGCQWTSPLTTATNTISLQPHFNIFLAVDIPLFNLCVVKKAKK